jgi:polysaccharide pyruvyl transferase CsaB
VWLRCERINIMGTPSYRVGISGSYGGMNLGDEAILEAIVTQLRASISAEVTVFTRDADHTLRHHDVDHAVPVRQMTRDEARLEVEKLDLLILGGGGILYDQDVELYLREVALAHEAQVPVVVYAISAGPLNDPSKRKLVAKHLNEVAALTVRDRQSLKLLEEAGVQREIVLTADPALLLEPDPIPPETLKREGLDAQPASRAEDSTFRGPPRLIGFSVREPGPAAPDMDIEYYHALLANAADFMVARLDANVVFVPMELKKQDVQHSHAVVARMQHAQKATVLKGEYTAPQMLALMGQFQFCVGMRLHFLIFAALQGIPFVSLPYASKVEGFLEDLDLPMPSLTEVTTGGLIAYVDRAWDIQGEIRRKIKERLPELQERARQANGIVVQVLSEARSAKLPV